MAAVVVAAAVAQSLASIGSTISSIGDAKKRREYEQGLATLSFDQQVALNKLLLEANSESAREEILRKTLTGAYDSRINALTTLSKEREATNRQLKTIALIGGFLIIGIFGLILIKRK